MHVPRRCCCPHFDLKHRIITYNTKKCHMTRNHNLTAPPGHVHEDFSTVIDEVKPAPVDKRKLVLHYIGRSLSACSCSLHTLSPSPDLNKTSLALSPLTVAQRAGRIRPPGREGGLTLSPSARHYRHSCSLSTQRRRGRASDPFFFATVPSPTEPRPKNLKV